MRLTATYSEVVVKLGPEGALWCSRSDAEGVRVAAAPPPGRVVDTTGAGDAFAAAWLAARSNGEQPEPALRTATEAAALVVTRVGARP
jgi:sugar/nucleoside kinase (ribokinase family)